MLIPIRCFTCGKVIAHLWNDYLKTIAQKKHDCQPNAEGKVLTELGVIRYCCRRMFLGNVELIPIIS
jgi:DNA-directed RNA polymerase subunit N (RpoN/RPB10)